MDISPLRDMVHEWLQAQPRKLEQHAFLKDAIGLVSLCHKDPKDLRIRGSHVADQIVQACMDLRAFLQKDIIQLLRHSGGGRGNVASPYVGGVPVEEHLRQLNQYKCTDGDGLSDFVFGSFNPGRTGLSALGTDNLLHWRLWAIHCELIDSGVHFCALPGARFPPGATLPEGFRFVWRGVQSVRWGSVGVFIDIDYEHLFSEVDHVGNERCIWFRLQVYREITILGALYGPPGGDLVFWKGVVADYASLRKRYPGAQIILMGDANIHLSYILKHEYCCACLHCNQTACDRNIEALLTSHGIIAHNPACGTHVSGTAINLILSDITHALLVSVKPVPSAMSDHTLVMASTPMDLSRQPSHHIGRVSWAPHGDWENGLLRASTVTRGLREAIEPMLVDPSLRPPQYGGSVPKKRRRALLDLAAWCRDTVYVIIGHTCSAVAVRPCNAAGHKRACIQSPSLFQDHQSFKEATARAAWKASGQSTTTGNYVDRILVWLRSSCPVSSTQEVHSPLRWRSQCRGAS